MTDTSGADCVFCKIIAGDIPSRVVDQDEHSLAFLDIAPLHRGHTLVVPKRHVENFVDESPAFILTFLVTTYSLGRWSEGR